MSRKDEKQRKEEAIEQAVAYVRGAIQSEYAATGNARSAIKAGTDAITEMTRKHSKHENSILFFCELEKNRLVEAMRVTDNRAMSLKERWLQQRDERAALKGA